jgi:hypothetical protein
VGEPIRDGFRVVDGSELIGPALPIGVAYFFEGEPVIDGGFRAFFEVRGDPRDVINGYLGQARKLGLSDGTAGDSDSGPNSEPIGRAWCEHRDEYGGADEFACGGFARNGDETDPRSLVLSFARGRVGDNHPFSHLEMRYSTTPTAWETGPLVAGDLNGRPDPPPVPEDLGQPANESTLFAGWPPVEPVDVLDGTLPVLEMPYFDCTAFTPLALLEVTGNPQGVIAAYAEQFSGITQEGAQVDPPLDVTGGRLRVARSSEAGGVEYAARLLETDEGSWLLIESCYD